MPPESPDVTATAQRPTLTPAEVHKAAADQVLLSDAIRVEGDRFVVAALWPGDHPLYHPNPRGCGDPNFVVESVRQAAIYLSHRFYGIDPAGGQVMIMSRIETDVAPPGLPYAGDRALPVVMDITVTRTERRSSRVDMSLEAEIFVEGVRRARAAVHWLALPARQYGVLRRRNSSTATADSLLLGSLRSRKLAPEEVGRRHANDVLLAAADGLPANSWLLAMGRTHPVFFDHDSDHIQGMVLLEALFQAARLTRRQSASAGDRWDANVSFPRFTADYRHFGEFGQPVVVTAERGADPAEGLVLTAVQGDRTLVHVTLADHESQEAVPC